MIIKDYKVDTSVYLNPLISERLYGISNRIMEDKTEKKWILANDEIITGTDAKTYGIFLTDERELLNNNYVIPAPTLSEFLNFMPKSFRDELGILYTLVIEYEEGEEGKVFYLSEEDCEGIREKFNINEKFKIESFTHIFNDEDDSFASNITKQAKNIKTMLDNLGETAIDIYILKNIKNFNFFEK